jgi:hypothetical protein
MIRNLFASAFALFATFGVATSALACPGGALEFHDISVSAEGTVSRRVFVKRDTDGQDSSGAPVEYARVVRDSIKLENEDEITLNALPSAVDQTYKIKIRREAQDADKGGVISTTYKVTEISVPGFGGVYRPPVEKTYLARVKGNYQGNGRYVMGCGEVTKMEIDFPADR